MMSLNDAVAEQLCKASNNLATLYTSGEYTQEDIVDIVIDGVLNNYNFDQVADADTVSQVASIFVREHFPEYFKRSGAPI